MRMGSPLKCNDTLIGLVLGSVRYGGTGGGDYEIRNYPMCGRADGVCVATRFGADATTRRIQAPTEAKVLVQARRIS